MERYRNSDDRRAIFFFDIDDCLYSKAYNIQGLLQDLRDKFFEKHLSLAGDKSRALQRQYRLQHGLIASGLQREKHISPLIFNDEVDNALPLQGLLKPDRELRRLLEDIDRSKIKLWLFTNSYVTHALRVVTLLGIRDLFEGITYCDYAAQSLICKPNTAMFTKAMVEAGANIDTPCFFIDDSYLNCCSAQALGWTAIHLLESDSARPASGVEQAPAHTVRSLKDLRTLFPYMFLDSLVPPSTIGADVTGTNSAASTEIQWAGLDHVVRFFGACDETRVTTAQL